MVSAWEGEKTEGQKETRRWEETMETMTLAIIFYLYFPYILYIFNIKYLNIFKWFRPPAYRHLLC